MDIKYFEGDIVITDPGYIIPAGSDGWEVSNDCDNMENLGLKTNLVSYTGIGDWSNSITDSKGNVLGEFCADCGLVGVFLLDEVLSYNPDFKNDMEKNPHIATVIKGFKGNVIIDDSIEDWTVVRGDGNIKFSSEEYYSFDEDE